MPHASVNGVRLYSEALARALPEAKHVRVGGDHAIDPAGPEVLSFASEVSATRSPA